MVAAAFLFATMGLCVKSASSYYHTAEIVFYRGLVGALMLAAITWHRGGSLRTAVPAMHFWRSLSGVAALCMWFYALGKLPLATAMTLNYMSSVWMALFLLGGAILLGGSRLDGRLIAAVLCGFAGVALILRPTLEQEQLWHGLVGLLSGMLSATAYLQVTALGRAGEPEYRVVFYFSLGGVTAGALAMLVTGTSPHSLVGFGWLIAVGVSATLAQLLMTRAYATGKPLVNASLQYLGIVFAFLYGVLLFDDPVTWMAVAGMLLIVLAGLAATFLRARAAPATTTSTTTET
ncbi:DMT family transporter [Aquabacterium sp. A7-Y]|uniref:DMT family transporter n=1 Tax=Aquabacterium sp. A7-Y TaxID=1349605 RepID=UPI00223D327D|nr:DMT family transporter [Aquabacterium sp. A7-Y]MCW7539144.1 DMT family transporter [Aquabacterium sp. A7-Y]